VSFFTDSDREPYLNGTWYKNWEIALEEEINEYNKNTTYINFVVVTIGGFQNVFVADLLGDVKLMVVAIMLVGCYSIIFLGNCNPYLMRSCPAIVGLICVGLSYTMGFTFSFLLGYKVAAIHTLMPFLLIGIGVDDMFVIANAID
jgi:predicted RND superfamily exporter protein